MLVSFRKSSLSKERFGNFLEIRSKNRSYAQEKDARRWVTEKKVFDDKRVFWFEQSFRKHLSIISYPLISHIVDHSARCIVDFPGNILISFLDVEKWPRKIETRPHVASFSITLFTDRNTETCVHRGLAVRSELLKLNYKLSTRTNNGLEILFRSAGVSISVAFTLLHTRKRYYDSTLHSKLFKSYRYRISQMYR